VAGFKAPNDRLQVSSGKGLDSMTDQQKKSTFFANFFRLFCQVQVKGRYKLFVVLFFLLTDFLMSRMIVNETRFRIRHPYYHHGLREMVKEDAIWGSRRYEVYTNSMGFKDKSAREIPKKSDKRRVLFMGDSFVEGIGLPYEQTFIGILAAGDKAKEYEVYNAGVTSYSPKLYYLKTKYLLEASAFEFDELYVFVDISDIQDEIIYEAFDPGDDPLNPAVDTSSGKGNAFYKVELESYLQNFSLIGRVVLVLKNHLFSKADAPLQDFYYVQRDQWVYDDTVWDRWGRKGLDLAGQGMKQLVDICDAQKIKVTIVVYPWPSTIKEGRVDTRHTAYWRNFALQHNTGFVDINPTFLGMGTADEVIGNYFIDGDCHFNWDGHRIIADKLQL
jgi:hypothetical protein